MSSQRQTNNRVNRLDRLGDSTAYVGRVLARELRPVWLGYLVAGLLNGIVTLLLLAFEAAPLSRFPIFYTLSTAAVAYWFGLFPAMFAFILSSTIFFALFIHTEGPWWNPTTDAVGLAGIVAFLVGTFVGGVGALVIRRSRERIGHLAEELASTNERLTSVLESVTDAFLALDHDWRFTYVNPAAGRLLDKTPRELLGKVLWEEFSDVVGSRFDRESRKAMEERITVAMEEHYSRLGKWLEIRAYPSADGLAIYMQDVTERRLTEEAIRQANQHRIEFYRRTLLAATGGKLVITGNAEIEAIAGPPIAVWSIERPEDLRTIRRQSADALLSEGFDDERVARFSVSIGEAITNALKHAGGGKASLHRLPESMMFVICDHGPGFEELNLPDVALTDGFSTAGTLGMGYKVILSFSDKVYLATGDDGSTVAMELERHPVEKQPYGVQVSPSAVPERIEMD